VSWILTTTDSREDGIFSELHQDDELFAVTLEHAYQQLDGTWAPKLPRGDVYQCERGMHILEHYNHGEPFETFEITGVSGHSGILFHPGNLNKDSDGCLLLGEKLVTLKSGVWMVIKSQLTFNRFMNTLDGVNEFTLEVS
jgi:hypothetical protein